MPDLMPEGFEQAPTISANYLKMSIIVLSVVLLFYAGLVAYKVTLNNKIHLLDSQIEQASQQIDSGLGSEAANSVKKLEAVKELLNSRIYWSDVFAKLEASTLSSAEFSDFNGDSAGKTIVLHGNFVNYTALAKQIVLFRQTFASTSFAIDSGSSQDSSDKDQENNQNQEDSVPHSGISASIELVF